MAKIQGIETYHVCVIRIVKWIEGTDRAFRKELVYEFNERLPEALFEKLEGSLFVFVHSFSEPQGCKVESAGDSVGKRFVSGE